MELFQFPQLIGAVGGANLNNDILSLDQHTKEEQFRIILRDCLLIMASPILDAASVAAMSIPVPGINLVTSIFLGVLSGMTFGYAIKDSFNYNQNSRPKI